MPRRFNCLDLVLYLLPVALLLQKPVETDIWQGFGVAGQLGLRIAWIGAALGAFVIAARTGAMMSSHIPRNIRLSLQGTWELGAALVIVALLILRTPLSTGPGAVSLLGFALVNYLLWQYLLGRRRSLWILVLAFGLWANVHNQFSIGLAQVGLAAAIVALARAWPALQKRFPFQVIEPGAYAAKVRHLALIFAISLLATFISPQPVQPYADLWRTISGLPAQAGASGWPALSLGQLAGLLPVACIALFIGWLAWKRKTVSAWHLLLLPIHLCLALVAAQNMPVLVLFALPWIYCAFASDRVVRWFFDSVVDFHFGIRLGDGLYYFYNAVVVLMAAGILIFRLAVWLSASDVAVVLHQAP